MCWFIYGAVQGDVDGGALEGVNSRHECTLTRGTLHDIKMAALFEYVDEKHHVTGGLCDCDSPIGAHDAEDPLVKDLAGLLDEVGSLPGAKTIFLSKVWAGKRNKQEHTLRLSETDLTRFAADLEPGTLYTLRC